MRLIAGAEVVKELVQHHGGQRDIVLSALSALGRVASSEAAVNAMQRASMSECITTLIAEYSDDEKVAQLALMVLESIAVVERHRGTLRRLGVIDVSLRAKHAFPLNAAIQTSTVSLAGRQPAA